MITKSTLLAIATSTIFRKVPLDTIELVLKNQVVLRTMNAYTNKRYGKDFWYGELSFNPDFRLVCPPMSFDFNRSVGFPFLVKTIFIEHKPFTEGQDYAKFGIHWRLTEPLLEG